MRIPILTIGAFASILTINSAFADTIVTSKQYVDTTRQAIIPAAGTNYDENGGGVSVVTYTEDGAGILGERFICDADVEDEYGCASDYLVTRDLLEQANNSLGTKKVTTKTCVEWLANQVHTDENCILWNLSDERVYSKCQSSDDCNCYDENGHFAGQQGCENGRCVGGCRMV